MIALVETMTFDDLEFTSLIPDLLLMFPLRLDRGNVTLAVGNGKKRIVFESASNMSNDGFVCRRKLVFIVLPEAVPNAELPPIIFEKVRKHVSQHSHVCLFYHNRDGHGLLDFFRAYTWGGVEWCSRLHGAVSREGLLFSTGWDRDVSLHVANVLEKYSRELPYGKGVSISIMTQLER